jgi:GDP-L-fucose synthase
VVGRKGRLGVQALSKETPIFVAGHTGMIGSAVCRRLRADGFEQILTVSSRDLDLRDRSAVLDWFAENKPNYAYLTAGSGGSIEQNRSRPADFLLDNLMIQSSLLQAARVTPSVRKALFLCSATVYPQQAKQPVVEEALLTGPLEESHRPYSLANIASLEMVKTIRQQDGLNFVSAVSTNVYGPGDQFDETGNVVPALIRRFHDAATSGQSVVDVWGTGLPLRDFMYVDDCADAIVHLMHNYDAQGHVNIGTGVEVSIQVMAETIRDLIAPGVDLRFDVSKPDGASRMCLDIGLLRRLGWASSWALEEGLRATVEAFIDLPERTE